MLDKVSWFALAIAVVLIVLLALEIWVIILISGFLASWFGFNGVLWWVCAFMIFCLINGVIGAVYNLR